MSDTNDLPPEEGPNMRKFYASLILTGFVASLTLGACGGKPSEDDCKKFADKVIELTSKGQDAAAAELAKGMLEGMKPEMIKECVEKGTKAEVECVLKADTMEALEKCGGGEKK
ncbi:MAG: TIGR04454 family lipoprotein [Nannocystis sp.]|nr:TIGR04454 family lipoprotein [Nannocystis sp.]